MSSDLSPNLIVNQQISKEHELAPVLDRAPTYSPPPEFVLLAFFTHRTGSDFVIYTFQVSPRLRVHSMTR